MPATAKCPDQETLKQLLVGALPVQSRDHWEQHLATCDRCASTADTIVASDDLTEAIRKRRVISGDENIVSELIERGKRLRHSEAMDQTSATALDETRDFSVGASSQRNLDPSDQISFLSAPEQPDEIGRLGGYRVLKLLGAGGMGVVFLAEDPKLERLVALKAMKPSIAASSAAKERFLREAKATAAIDHHHIVQIYQVGEDDGVPFIAMQYLQGESLQSRIDRDGKLSQQDLLKIGAEVATGLQAAHDTGLIHRDIKPDNIWIDEKTGWAKILDFGLVRAASDDAGLTHSGTIMGTPRYMSPEQTQGSDVGPASDLFSLGSVLYHLASGQPPFAGGNLTATLIAVATTDPTDLGEIAPELNADLSSLVMRLLSKKPADRPPSAGEVATDLATLQQQGQDQVAPTSVNLNINVQPRSSEKLSRGRAKKNVAKAQRSKPKPSVAGIFRNPKLLIATGLAAVLILGTIVFQFKTENGTVIVQIDDPADIATVEVDGRSVSFTPSGSDKQLTFTVDEGSHKLTLKTVDGLELTTDLGAKPLEIKAGENTQLRAWVEPGIAANDSPAKTPPLAASKFPRPKYDPSPLPKLGTWEPVGTVEVGKQFPDGRIGTADALPGLAMLPVKLPGIRRWNVETGLPRGRAAVAKFSPDDKLLAVGSADGHVRIYDAETLELKQLLPGLSGGYGVTNLDWHPDSNRLAANHAGGDQLSIWNVNGQLMAEPDCLKYRGNAMFSPDGERLLTSSLNGGGQHQICVRNVDGTIVKKIDANESKAAVHSFGAMAWSPDSQSFASLHLDNELRIWSREGELKTEVDGFGSFEKGFYSVQWKPTGEWIGVVDANRPGEIQRISPTGERGDPLKLSEKKPIHRFQWGSAGKKVYGASGSFLHVLDVATDEATEHRPDGSWDAAMAVSHSEERIVSMYEDRKVFDRHVNLVQKVPLSFFPWNCRWNGPGNAFVVGDGRHFSRWDSTGNKVSQFGSARGNSNAIAWHPEGKRIVLSTEHLRGIHLGNTDDELKQQDGRGYYRLSWNADGNFFAGATYRGKHVGIYDSPGSLVKQIDCPANSAQIAFHPKLDLLVVQSDPELLTCSSADDWTLTSVAKVNPIGYDGDLSWSPSGHQLHVQGTGIFDFDGEKFSLAREFTSHDRTAWRSGIAQLVTAGGSHIGLLHAAQDGPHVMKSHTAGQATSIDAHPNRDLFTTTHYDSTIISWDADTMEPYWRAVLLPEDQSVTITAAGQIMHGDRKVVDKQLIYYVENDDGRIETLTSSEFEKRIGQSLYIPEQPAPLVTP